MGFEEYTHLDSIKIEDYLDSDDFDKKGIELALEGLSNVHPRKNHCCGFDLIVFEAFFNYFLENLRKRKVDSRVISQYVHNLMGAKTVHCFYNCNSKYGCFYNDD